MQPWAVGFACACPGRDDKKACGKNSKGSWSNGMKNKKAGLLLVGMWPNIFLIGRALYLAVREAVKSGAVPIRRGAQLAGLLLMPQLWYMRLHWAFIRKLHHKPKHTHTHKLATQKLLLTYSDAVPSKQAMSRFSTENAAKKKVFNDKLVMATITRGLFFHKLTVKIHQWKKKKTKTQQPTKLQYSNLERGRVCRSRNASAWL